MMNLGKKIAKNMKKIVKLFEKLKLNNNRIEKLVSIKTLYDDVILDKTTEIDELLSVLKAEHVNSFSNNISRDRVLHQMVLYNSFNATKLLLANGADPNLPNSSGNTPLHLAFSLYAPKTILLLMQYGANCDIVNSMGATPLNLGLTHKNPYVVAVAKICLSIETAKQLHEKERSSFLHKDILPNDLFKVIIAYILSSNERILKMIDDSILFFSHIEEKIKSIYCIQKIRHYLIKTI